MHLLMIAALNLQGAESKISDEQAEIRFSFAMRYQEVIRTCTQVKKSDCLSATDDLKEWLKEQRLDSTEKELLIRNVSEIPDILK